jgi:hypothetical protein
MRFRARTLGRASLLPLVVLLVLGLLAPSPAGADEPRKLEAEIRVSGEMLYVSFELPGLITSDLRERLQSGLVVRLVYRIRVRGGGATVASTNFLRQIRYLLWDGTYRLESTESPEPRHMESLDAACGFLASFRDYPLTPKSGRVPEGPFVVKVDVVVDPVFDEERKRVEEWLLDPGGRGELGSRGLINVMLRWFLVRERDLEGERIAYRSAPIVPTRAAQ